MVRLKVLALAGLIVVSGLAASSLVFPIAAHAAIGSFTGSIVPTECNCPNGAGWGCALSVLKNLIQFILYLGILGFTAAIVYAGWMWMTSAVNPGAREEARGILMNAFIGFMIAAAAWLIINTFFTVLTTNTLGGVTSSLGGTSGNCLPTATDVQGVGFGTSSLGTNASGTPSGSPSTVNGNGGAGTCSVAPPGSACDPNSSAMQSAFGSNATAASNYCMKESGGTPHMSTTDVTADGHSYSGGYFQMNLTNSFNIKVDGQSCASAFSGPCQNGNGVHNLQGGGKCSVTVVNEQLYNDCVAAANNPQNGMAAAASLSQNGSNWGHWANECHA